MSSDDSEDEDLRATEQQDKSKSKHSKKHSKRSKKHSKHSKKKEHRSSDGAKDGEASKAKKGDKKAKKSKKSKKKHKKKIGGGSGGGSKSSGSSSSGSSSSSDSNSNSNSSDREDPFDTGISKIEKPFDGFYVMCSGQIESAEFYGVDNLYCKYTFYYGQHWTPVAGVETAVSQISRKGRELSTVVTWNFPVEVTFRATNAHGWPRLVLSVYSIDMFGRDVVRGYGSLVIPPFGGRYVRYCRVFKPRSSSAIQSMIAWLTVSCAGTMVARTLWTGVSDMYSCVTGPSALRSVAVQANSPEFFDAKFVAAGEGRKNTQVISTGVVKVALDIATRGMEDVGFSVNAQHSGGLSVDHGESVTSTSQDGTPGAVSKTSV